MTDIGAITQTAGGINLGPVFGDLQGSVAAEILGVNTNGTFTVQYYWVTAAGDTILLKQAILTPITVTPTHPTGNVSGLQVSP